MLENNEKIIESRDFRMKIILHYVNIYAINYATKKSTVKFVNSSYFRVIPTSRNVLILGCVSVSAALFGSTIV